MYAASHLLVLGIIVFGRVIEGHRIARLDLVPSCPCWVTEYDGSTALPTATNTFSIAPTSTVILNPFRSDGSKTQPLTDLPEFSVPVGGGYWQAPDGFLCYVDSQLETLEIHGTQGATNLHWTISGGKFAGHLYFTLKDVAFYTKNGLGAMRLKLIPKGSVPIGAGVWRGPDNMLYDSTSGPIPVTQNTAQASAYELEFDSYTPTVRIHVELNGAFFVLSGPSYSNLQQLSGLPTGSRILGHGLFQGGVNNGLYFLWNQGTSASLFPKVPEPVDPVTVYTWGSSWYGGNPGFHAYQAETYYTSLGQCGYVNTINGQGYSLPVPAAPASAKPFTPISQRFQLGNDGSLWRGNVQVASNVAAARPFNVGTADFVMG